MRHSRHDEGAERERNEDEKVRFLRACAYVCVLPIKIKYRPCRDARADKPCYVFFYFAFSPIFARDSDRGISERRISVM